MVKEGAGYKLVSQSGNQDDKGRYPVFTSNKDAIPTGKAYGSGVITTSVKDDGRSYYNAYFAGDLNVRVAKPAVTTIG